MASNLSASIIQSDSLLAGQGIFGVLAPNILPPYHGKETLTYTSTLVLADVPAVYGYVDHGSLSGVCASHAWTDMLCLYHRKPKQC